MENFFKNIKNRINLIRLTKVFAFVFVIFFVATGFVEFYSILQKNESNTQLIEDAINFSTRVQNEDATSTPISNLDEQALFTNSKDAAIYAFSKLANYSSFEMTASSDVDMSIEGYNATMKMQSIMMRYANGNELMQINRYQTSNTGSIDLGLTRGYMWYFSNGMHYEMITRNVTKSGNTLISNFSGLNYKLKTSALTKNMNFYKVDTSTIVTSGNFEIKYHPITKKIQYYYATVVLNPMLSTKEYVKHLQEQTNLNSYSFKNLVLNLEISNTGDIVSMNAQEEYTAKGSFSAITYNVTFNDVMYYEMKSINKTPSFQEPTI